MAKKTTPLKQTMSKSQIFAEIAESTDLTKKQVAAVFAELSGLVERHVKKGAVGQFTLPGLLKVKAVKRPARPAQKGVPNPFKPGELMDVPARPASMKVKVLPLKALKQMVL
jgi:nucleoid DNA-binding protein